MMIATTHFQRCQQDQGDVEKAESSKGNNKKKKTVAKKIHGGIKTWDRTNQVSIHHGSS